MTPEEIIEMADMCGLLVTQQLEAFAKLVAEKEREACAVVCDKLHRDWKWRAAESIRARGEA
jgi:hypothetical protein